MDLLLDTHTSQWCLQMDPQLGVLARTAITNPRVAVWVWAVRVRLIRPRLKLASPPCAIIRPHGDSARVRATQAGILGDPLLQPRGNGRTRFWRGRRGRFWRPAPDDRRALPILASARGR